MYYRRKYELGQHRWGSIFGIPRIRRNGNVFVMEIPRFYRVERREIGGLMEISLVMIRKSLHYTLVDNKMKRINRSYKSRMCIDKLPR